ncbi:MAG: cache domain-containing protein [Desulfosarcina sp.]|nr:cache domain-containing protein [Desulfobacterales bacterium]
MDSFTTIPETDRSERISPFRIILPAVLSVVLFLTVISLVVLPYTESRLVDLKQQMIRELVETALDTLAFYEAQARNGTLSRFRAQDLAIRHLHALRYGPEDKDYFWINDFRPQLIMHPYREDLLGKDVSDYQDQNGKYLFRDFINVVRQHGRGYVDYMWQWKDDPSRVVPKISYVAEFRPWKWIVGTGVYIEDIHEEVATLTGRLIGFSAIILLLITGLSGFYIWAWYRGERQRRRAWDALTDSRSKYRAVLESSPNAVVVYDDKGQVLYLNPAFDRIFGWKLEELQGRRVDFVPEANRDETAAAIETAYREGHYAFETQRLTQSGRVLDISLQAAIYRGADDQAMGMVVNLEDISARKKAEEEKMELLEKLSRSKKMEALGMLAGGVAHDLNNVLSGIVSYPDLILMDLPTDSPLRGPITTIQDSGIKAATIVQDLLTLARRGVTALEIMDLNAVVADYLKSPEYQALSTHHPDVHFEVRYDADLSDIMGSAAHLRKAIMNLAGNAAEAQPDGGHVRIATQNRYLDRPIKGYGQVSEGEYVVLSVADDGEGIAAEELPRIFEPFYTKKVLGRSGTGLGMAVVWGTIQDHKGYIDVQSEEGGGTVFDLYFPMTREKRPTANQPLPREACRGRNERILVVDDVSTQREIASRILARLNYEAAAVAGGEQAIEYLRTQSVDLVMLDMIMDPGMDGLDTYREILRIRPDVKVIIVSGYAETERVKEALHLGVRMYLKKPYTMEKLGQALREAFDGQGGGVG